MFNVPKTLQDAVIYFSDTDRAFQCAVELRWPGGKVICPRCSQAKHSFIKTRKLWFCYVCKKQFTVKVKSIFEDSAVTLDKWMIALWMLCNCKNGVSSVEIHKAIGVTQKTAWFMLQRLRTGLGDRKFGIHGKLGGGEGSEVEVDETFVGGKLRNMHASRRAKINADKTKMAFGVRPDRFPNKVAVMGMLDRELRKVRAKVVPDVKRETLQNEVLNNIKYGSKVYTDSAVGYETLRERFVHDVVNHAETYVKGRVHTNGLENFWSLLKRSLRGTYVAVEPFHLHRYLDEQVFRYNNRATKDNPLNDFDRFVLAMSQIGGKRLTYADLTAKSDSPHHAETGARETQVPF